MPAPQESDPLRADLERLWVSKEPEILSRLRVIEDYVANCRRGRFDVDTWRVAQREAHRLAGSLGIYGFEVATDLARQLNRLLRTDPPSLPADRASGLLTAIRQEIKAGPQQSGDEGPVAAAAGPDSPARVLLAEDDVTVAAAVREALRLDGLDLLWAIDGAAAVRLAREYDVDLMLLDFDLPGFDGLEVCRQVREDPRMATIPIVLMTGGAHHGFPSNEDLPPCISAYLAKPFKVADLRSRVRTLLAGGRATPRL
jgi:CheY-like chemotaxis protein